MMESEPNYGKQTLQQLYDVRRHIDKERFPERWTQLEAEIACRERDRALGPAEAGSPQASDSEIAAPPRFSFRPRPSDGLGHTSFHDKGGTAEWRIPVRSNVIALGFLLFWLSGWGVIAYETLSNPGTSPLRWLLLWAIGGVCVAVLCLWLAFGQEVITVGHNELRVRRVVFGLGPSKTYDLRHVKNIRVSPSPLFYDSARRPRPGRTAWGFGYGVVAFDYDASGGVPEHAFMELFERFFRRLIGGGGTSSGRGLSAMPDEALENRIEISDGPGSVPNSVTIRFGEYVDEPEANLIVEKLRKKYPSLGPAA